MSIADLIRRMSSAGAPAEAIAIAVEAIEAEQDKLAERRAKAAERKARQRNKERDSHATVTGHDRDKVSPKKETSPTPPKEKTTPSVVSEPDGSSTIRPEPAIAAPNSVIGLPTVSDGDFPIFEADLTEWSSAFPGVDIRQQLAAMRQWLIANPTRRKTTRGMRKFVISWLDRRQNSAPALNLHHPSTSPPRRERSVSDVLSEISAGTWTGPKGNHHEPDFIDTSFSRRN